MARSGAPRRLPLTGADGFLRAFDHEVRRTGGASHASQLVLRLGPGFELEAFRKLVAEAARAQPILRAPIRRRAGVGVPEYRLDRAAGAPLPPVRVHPGGARRAGTPTVLFDAMNEPFDGRRGELLRFDVVPYAGGAAGTDVAMTWLHMLFDGAGSEAFVAWLDAVGRGEASPHELPEGEMEPAPGLPPGLSARERGARARAWQAFVDSLAGGGVRSPAGPLRRERQALAWDAFGLAAEATARAVETARARAGFLTPMLFYLAAALRAHREVFRLRGAEPERWVVPLPVNLRPKGRPEALFRTRVSLLWFHVSRECAADPQALLEELKRQRRDAIRAGHVENGAIAMDFARFAPMRLYAHMARRPFRGELCSFFFAWTGDFLPGLERFFGAPIEEAFHAPAVTPSPGSSLAMSLRPGRLTATHVFQRGAFTDAERAVLREHLLGELLGSGA